MAAILVAAFAFAPRQEVVTEVGIDATPAQLWALLGDPGSYRDWNPFIVSVEGALAEGETLVNRMRPGTGNQITFKRLC
ncbi:SRPBCC family protein [Paracoccus sp. MKU1]|uniref:SRPBCC family protein n=1 Tax=Paracoccus sp. MKU1 TaxID=1745182 RepID=UPI0007190824|nr:SRPBCC family protein [Paracoccus sp. MKU1]KRW94064.1 hypothetical protein AQY21_21575 [Paracoccus sp. MKU1]